MELLRLTSKYVHDIGKHIQPSRLWKLHFLIDHHQTHFSRSLNNSIFMLNVIFILKYQPKKNQYAFYT
jgi:hypothetical protein